MKLPALPGCLLWPGAALLALCLGGCAAVNDAGLWLVSTRVDAYLLVNNQWLKGDALLAPDRSGRVSFAATKGAITRCSGGLRYTGTSSAEIGLYCNDGTQLTLQATLQGETRGYGYGATAQGPASLAFGLEEDEAHAFMGRVIPATGSAAGSGAAPESPAQTP